MIEVKLTQLAVNSKFSGFTEREISEIAFAQIYAEHFNHGTDGHNRLLLISKLAYMVMEQDNDNETGR